MSIIETAVKNLQQQGEPDSKAAARRPSRRDGRAIDPGSVRQFRPASLSQAALRDNSVLPAVTDHAALRGYKILRTRLLQRLSVQQLHSVAVTSPESGQGKTLTALNLAIALSQDPNTWVFLVDLDLKRPQVASRLGMQIEQSLSDYLLGTAELDQIIYDPGIPRLSIVANSRPIEHSSEALAGPRMLQLMRTLEAEAPRRVIIYDMPPMLLADDVLTMAPHLDGVLLVLSEGLTERANVEKAKELLKEMNFLGVILNRSSERDDSSYY